MNRLPMASIIIPAWNGKAFLADCLNSLLSQDYPHFEVIVVDNASSDGTPDWVAAHYPQVRLIRNERNLGFAAGVNVGLRAASGEALLLLNQDTLVQPGWLRALVSGLLARPEIGIAGSKIYYWGGKAIWHAGIMLIDPRMQVEHRGDGEIDQGQYEQLTDVEAVTGAALAIRRSVLERIGLFDEDYFVYFEDVDFCLRASAAGFRVVYVPGAIVQHRVAASLEPGSPAVQDRYHRSRLLFLLKHFGADWFRDRFFSAETRWLNNALNFSECYVVRQVYLDTISALNQNAQPYQFVQQRFDCEQRKIILDVLQRLVETIVEAVQSESNERVYLAIPIEIGDPAIDYATLRQTLATDIVKRRRLAVERNLDFVGLAQGRVFTMTSDEFSLRELQLYQDKIHVHLTLTPRPYTRFGFLRSIFTRLREELHGLAAFYSNLLGQRQILFNERLVQLLATLSFRLQATESLVDQVASLQQRIEALERQLERRTNDD